MNPANGPDGYRPGRSAWYNIPMTYRLRDYQIEARDRIADALTIPKDGAQRNRVVGLGPTGCGKTVIAGATLAELMNRGIRKPLFLVHTDELVSQSVATLGVMIQGASIGVVKAERNDINADVIVGSVQTIARESRREQLRGIGALFIDECHHAAAPTYQSVMYHVGSFDATPTAGFTATLVRADNKRLGDTWTEVVFKRDILWMIKNGYLCDVKGYTVQVADLDMEDVKGGRDYKDESLGQALIDSSAAAQVVEAWEERAAGRPTVLFAPTVASAQMFTDAFNDAGITAECVFGTTDLDERAEIYKRVRDGKTMILCNCMVLTEGFDLPPLSCCIVARPTKSPGLYIQMVGRVLRTWKGKDDALVLDVAGIASQHALCTLADLSTGRKDQEVKESESLSEAAERWIEEGADIWNDSDQPPPPLVLTEVDLFAGSNAAWSQTPKGTWFVATRQHVYYLRPQRDGQHYGVFRSASSYSRRPETLLVKDVEIDFAMAYAQQLAEDADPSIALKGASWRQGNRKPSAAQVAYADKLGINTSGMNKREVADAITLHNVVRMGL